MANLDDNVTNPNDNNKKQNDNIALDADMFNQAILYEALDNEFLPDVDI